MFRDDAELIEEIWAGVEEAYAQLITRYQDEVGRQMWRFTHEIQDHENLVHDVFVEAYLSLRSYRGRAPFLHWLRKIASRTGFAYWKQRDRRRRFLPLDEALPRSTSGGEGLAAVTKEETRGSLCALLERLRPEERMVLSLACDEDLNSVEIAERMGWTHVMTRMRLSRARKRLRELAKGYAL